MSYYNVQTGVDTTGKPLYTSGAGDAPAPYVAPASSATPASAGITTPVSPVAAFSSGDTSGKLNADIANINTGVGNANATVDERTAATQKFQGEIDALNQVYAQQKQAETQAGLGRVGSTTAVEARRGLIGSDFGTALTDTQNTANTTAQQAIDSNHLLALSGVTAKINAEAATSAKNRYDSSRLNADSLIQNMKDAPAAQATAVKNAGNWLVNSQIDPSKLTPEQIQGMVDTINKGNSRYNVTASDLSSSYAAAKATNDAATQKATLDTANLTKAQNDATTGLNKTINTDNGTFTSADGGMTWKPLTGSVKPTIPTAGTGTDSGLGIDTPVDTTSQSILAQTGLSIPAFSFLTQGTTALTRMTAGQRLQYMNEAQNWANKNGIDISTFHSQYAALGKTVEANSLRNNQASVAEAELAATVKNLNSAAVSAGLGNLNKLNIAKIWAGSQLNTPEASTYKFHLEQLRNEFSMYNAALSGQIDSNGNIRQVNEADMAKADGIIQNGFAAGSLDGFNTALDASLGKMKVVLADSINAQQSQVWKLFGVTKPEQSQGTSANTAKVNTLLSAQGINYNELSSQMAGTQAQHPGTQPAIDATTGAPVFASPAEIASGKYIPL